MSTVDNVWFVFSRSDKVFKFKFNLNFSLDSQDVPDFMVEYESAQSLLVLFPEHE